MKNNVILFVLLIMLPLQGGSLSNLCVLTARDVGQEISSGPLAYAGLAGTAALACAYGNNPYALTGIGIASLTYHVPVVKSWWWLREELRSYPDEYTDNNLLKRTRWSNPDERRLNTGFEITQHYQQLDNDARKRNFANNLKIKVAGQENLEGALVRLDGALRELEQKINSYGKFSNLYYLIKNAAGQDLLTTDYLFENNIHDPYGLVRAILDNHTQGSLIANSFTIRWAYSPTLGIAVPWWYTWSHRMASQCIVKALYQYGRLKAIRRILEIYVPASDPTHNLNVRVVR